MKPTQEQVLQWAHETFRRQGDGFAAIDAEVMRFFTIAYEAGRKDEREACARVAESYEPRCDTCPSGVSNAIRARREQ